MDVLKINDDDDDDDILLLFSHLFYKYICRLK